MKSAQEIKDFLNGERSASKLAVKIPLIEAGYEVVKLDRNKVVARYITRTISDPWRLYSVNEFAELAHRSLAAMEESVLSVGRPK